MFLGGLYENNEIQGVRGRFGDVQVVRGGKLG